MASGRSAQWPGGIVRCVAVSVWALVFAAPHLYWAAGGRGGLGTQANVADAAFDQLWFFVYNLVVAVLALCGAVAVLVLAGGRGGFPLRRMLVFAATVAGLALLLRGGLGVVFLVADLADGGLDDRTPLILLAIEPYFLLGGLLSLGMAAYYRRARPDESAPAGRP